MNSTLLSIGPVTVYTFGVFLAFSYLLGIFSFWRAGRREGFSSDDLLDLVFVVTFAALLGGRFTFLLFMGGVQNLADIFRVGEGFFWIGALLFGAVALLLFSRVKGWSVFRITDNAAVSLAIAQAFGYLGAEVVNYLPFAFYPAFGYLFLWIFLRYLRVERIQVIPSLSYLAVSGLLVVLAEWLRPAKAVGWGVNINYAGGTAIAAVGIIGLLIAVAKKRRFKVKL